MKCVAYTTVVTVAVLLTAAADGKSPNGSEGSELDGTWNAVSGQQAGKRLPESDLARTELGAPITFHAGKLTISFSIDYTFDNPALSKKPKWERFDGRQYPLRFQVDSTVTPKHLNVHEGLEDDSPVMKCIYTIDKDTLTVCWGSDGVRPKEFKTKQGDGFTLIVYKRAEKREGPGKVEKRQ